MTQTSTLGYLHPTAYNLRNHVCVLPCGGFTDGAPSVWSMRDLRPYVSYLLDGRETDSLFNGFVFTCISTTQHQYLYPYYEHFGQPATSLAWLQWIDDLFTPNCNLAALYWLTNWNQPVDVWVSLPYPNPSQSDFGLVNGMALTFKRDEDRYQAVAWWIDRFVERWEKEKWLAGRLTFRGFLWQPEGIKGDDTELVKRITRHIREKGFLSIWLPNYGANGVPDYQALGFDVTAINPNYYGNTPYGVDWIQHASTFAKVVHTGMQIIFGKGMIYNDTHHLDYFNFGLPERCGYMTESFLVYQFPNQSLHTIYETRPLEYQRLYTFTKGLHTMVAYAGMSY
ncbi:DUF4855 domain-containing protein [Brevibacillus sp. SYP-B805]|uniref:DUF4855 domain-containing protein n=1 Tax=Brevibacillus sp. SYP-B805 TaxID=1578199 RepID=UPI0013ED8EF3|nr:DUF4855 domain-containing protein [Brevibacillus sp. SYP-B805]NGQ95926.1 DUF4855 domain-containing protein [Brevibacillus sp. SYP-B805]